MKLSASLIAFNEAHRVERCLESLRWVDELVVVVDERTTDATPEIARRYTDRVFLRPFTSYSDQRQWADQQTTGDWILSVDCDEVVPVNLAEEIQAALASPRYDAYRVPHLDYMFGRWIRHGGWHPQYHVRLYRRGKFRWDLTIHEKILVDGTVGTLRQPILHFAHGRVEDWVGKMAAYTTLEAQAMQKAGRRVGWTNLVLEPPLYFSYKFIVQQGWRDGLHGLTLALLLGCYRLVRNLKAWDLQQAARAPKEPEDRPPLGPRGVA